jgi:SMC interacting uncharacterized protein involved in chromosome segregation
MNAPAVVSAMRSINQNVRTELSNAAQITSTPNINLVPLWDAFMTQQFTKFENRGRTWVKERIEKDTDVVLSKTIKKYKMMRAECKKQETGAKSQAHAVAQRERETQLTGTLNRKRREVADAEGQVVNLREQRDALTKQIAAVKAQKTKKARLEKEKKDVEKSYKAAKEEVHKRQKQVGLTQRAIEELYSTSVGAIVDNLLRDKKQLANYRRAIPTLNMPRP